MPNETTPKDSKSNKKKSKKQSAKMKKKKIVLLGDSGVGKTSLIRRFVFDQFEDSYIATIGTKVSKKDLMLKKEDEDVKLSLMVWDLLGLEGYSALHADAFVGVHGAFLVSDLRRDDTLDAFERYWIPLLYKVAGSVPLIFVGNKVDLIDEPKAKLDRLQNMIVIAEKYNAGVLKSLPKQLASYYLTSAKTGENVERAFQSLGYLLLSPELLEDPMSKIDERAAAAGIQKEIDKSSSTGAIDAMILDFCKGFKNKKTAMSMIRLEFIRAGLNIRHPTRDSLLKAVDYLAESEAESKNEKIVRENKERRLKLIDGIKRYEVYRVEKLPRRK